jgi:hypothetical protein
MAALLQRVGRAIKTLRFPLAHIFFSRCFLVLLAYFGLTLIPVNQDQGMWRAFPDNLLVDGLFRWDSDWYHGIAEGGYEPPGAIDPGVQRNTAFFPLYPLLVRGLGTLVGSLWAAGLIVSNLAFLFACVGLFRLVDEQGAPDVAQKVVLFLCYSPFSIFFVAMYSESLFLMAVVLAFLFAERERWAVAGLFALMAGVTKVSGCLVVIGLLLRYVEKARQQRRPVKADIAFVLLGALGPLAHLAYLQLTYGSFLEFYHAQRVAGWAGGITIGSAVDTLRSLSNLRNVLSGDIPLMDLAHLAILIAFCVLIGYGLRKRVLSGAYTVWSLAMGLLSLAKWNSAGRSLAVVFPVYIVLAVLSRRDLVFQSLFALSVLFNSLFLILFTHWYWVA